MGQLSKLASIGIRDVREEIMDALFRGSDKVKTLDKLLKHYQQKVDEHQKLAMQYIEAVELVKELRNELK
jgi:hypothetical protein